ncbi:MAG: serine O-acetyltransferase EpsC [Candidatus Binatus sp.]|uniref:serine O-acetyltransferase EpsC n=1 Tax=Candidatus Binatus sp. TaxID=2811406 RepID=UPI003D0B96D9
MKPRDEEDGSGGIAGSDWKLDRIVAELRASRAGSQAGDKHEQAAPLPSRKAVARIVDGLFAALFPTHFVLPDLTDEGIDYFVGQTLDATLRSLVNQVRLELQFAARQPDQTSRDQAQQATRITREFAARLPEVRALLENDILAAYQGDPAAKSVEEVRVCYPGIWAITHHRLAHQLSLLGVPLLARIIAELAHSATGIDIHPGAKIGASFFIDHGTGVVIGETAIIGRRVRLYQAVTLGAKSFPVGGDGTLIKGIPRHPIVEDDVVIYAGATILGRVTIGRGSTIGGNVWLTRSVPPGSNITQAQVRSEEFDKGAGI